ncbi:MAG: YjbQ family protein [Planctomycetes bacterium]|nr:YjbQ family protein [Planctomycetota bacterium]
MTVATDTIKLSTRGHTDIHDITAAVQSALERSRLKNGIVTVFTVGSTAGITTVEYEPGLVSDLQRMFEEIAPSNRPYKHHERWGDDNGHSHVRASLLGPSITVPFTNGRLTLGTWQQIVLIDFDTRAREREIVLQMIGD